MPPRYETSTFEGADGTSRHAHLWSPDGPRAVVAVVHGLFEYGGRYGDVAAALADAGFAVAAYDQQGHGASAGHRGLVASLDALLDDLALFLARVRAGAAGSPAGLPVALLGHSMGGMLAAIWAAERAGDETDALVLSAPYLGAGPLPAPAVAAARLLGRLAPRVPTLRIAPEDVSRDPAVVADYRTDPLVVHGRIPARTGAALLAGARRARAAAERITCPLLLLQGGHDRLTAPESARRFYDAVASDDKTLAWYGPLFHEVLNEPERPHVLADLRDWLGARTGAGGPEA